MTDNIPDVGTVVTDSFTNDLLTVVEIEETNDGRDTYLRGRFTLDRNSGLQTRHINDVKAR